MVRRWVFCLLVVVLSCLPVLALDQDRAVKYFAHVAELVIKRDAKGLYKEGTEAFRKGVSLEKLQQFLDMALEGEEPVGLEVTGYEANLGEGLFRVTGFIELSGGEKVYLAVVMRQQGDLFRVHYINLQTERLRGKAVQEAKPAEGFVRGLLGLLREGKMAQAMAKVDPRVRQEVGDPLIEAIFKRMASAQVEGLYGFHTRSVEGERLQAIRLKASCGGSPCLLEFLLRPQGEGFAVLDANIYKLP